MKKRTLIIIGIVIVSVTLISVSILFLMNSRSAKPASNLGGSSNEQLVSQSKIFFIKLVNSDQHILGLTDFGTQFTKIAIKGDQQEVLLPDQEILSPKEVSYAPDGSAAIVHSQNFEQQPTTTLYDFVNKTTKTLDKHIVQVHWLSDNNTIVYLFQTDTKTSIVRADKETKQFETIIDSVPIQDAQLVVAPNGNEAIITKRFNPGQDFNELDYGLYHIDLQKKEVTELLPKGRFTPVFATDSQNIAYLRLDATDKIGRLSFFNLKTKQETATDVATLPGKYVWQQTDTLIVASQQTASPQDLTDDLNYSDSDSLFILKTDKTKTELKNIEESPSIEDLHVTSDGKTLFFRRLNYLRSVQLP